MLKSLILTAFGGLVAATTGAQAATIIFNGDVFGAPSGYTLFNDFNSESARALVTGSGFYFPTGTQPDAIALPGNDTPFLAITGGTADIAFSAPVRSFSFDYSTVDTYNTLTISYADGGSEAVGGSQFLASGQTSGRSSGSFIINGDGRLIAGLSLFSGSPAFEVDNLAISDTLTPVPEPASWAMFIVGFGLVGIGLRRRAAVSKAA